jgi:signal transduction histidine kinase
MVRAEEKMMTELCNILVDNAAKYCDDGGEVTVLLKKRGKGAQIQVSNTYQEGAGEDYGRFFRRFYRGDVSHNSKQSGYGIGLSMAQTIAEKFRGSIAAGWKNGVITFTVTL